MIIAKARKSIILSASMLFALVAAFYYSPLRLTQDSIWSIPTAASFLDGKEGELSDYIFLIKKYDYGQIEPGMKERPRAIYPIGVSLLALPAVAITELINPGFSQNIRTQIAVGLECLIASIIGAVSAVILFWSIWHRFQNFTLALLTMFIFCFCTSIWSTATRSLWQHGPVALFYCWAIYILVRTAEKPQLISYLGFVLACAYLMRPTAAVPIVVLTTYVLIGYTKHFLKYLAMASIVAAPFLAFNFHIYGTPLSPYYDPFHLTGSPSPIQLTGSPFVASALLGNFLSPTRGLFVYSPILILFPIGFVLGIFDQRERRLCLAFMMIIAMHWVAISQFPDWAGGSSQGPRYMIDVLPFILYLVAIVLKAVARMPQPWQRVADWAIAPLVAVSFLLHGNMALTYGPIYWNGKQPLSQERLWDWKDPQFLSIGPFAKRSPLLPPPAALPE